MKFSPLNNQKVAFYFMILHLVRKLAEGKGSCFLTSSSTQTWQQIQPVAYSQREGFTNFGPQYLFTVQLSTNNTDALLGTESTQLTQFFLTSNQFMLSKIVSKVAGFQQPPQLQKTTFYIAAAFTSQQVSSGLVDFGSVCDMSTYPQLALREFVLVNSQTQQLFIQVPIISQINDIYYLNLQYPTSLALHTQDNNNIGCQLYTDYIVINECQLISSSGYTTVSFDLSKMIARNISATVVLSSGTFNQNLINQNKPFRVTLLNQLEYLIAQSPNFNAINYNQCSQTNFSAQVLYNSSYQINEQRLQVKFTPVSSTISRILLEFSTPIIPKFSLTSITVIMSDYSLQNSFTVLCQKVYDSIILCDGVFTSVPTFDISKGLILNLPYFEARQAVPPSFHTFTLKYFPDYSFQTCFYTNSTIPFMQQKVQTPFAYLFNNNTLQVSFSNVINLENANIQLPTKLSFPSTAEINQISGISILSQISKSSASNAKITQVTQSLEQLTTFKGISFSLQNISPNSIQCNPTNPEVLNIQIINSFGVVILSGSILIIIEPYSIQIQSKKINQLPDTQQQQQIQQNGNFTDPVSLEINFQLNADYFPQQSAFVIYVPPQLIRDTRFQTVTVQIANQFDFYCKSQTNSTKFLDLAVPFSNTIQQRDTIVVLCQFSGNQTISSSSDVFTAKIQGYKLDYQVEKPTDRIIVDLFDYSQNQFQKQYLCQTTESKNNPYSMKNQWVFVKTNASNFIISKYLYQVSTAIYQDNGVKPIYSLINITTSYCIQDGDTIQINFEKQQFLKFETTPTSQSQIPSISVVKNLVCSTIYPLSSQPNSNNFITNCILVEKASSFSVQIQLKSSEIGQLSDWNNKDVVFKVTGLAFQENFQQSSQAEVLFQHFSNDQYLVSQSTQKFANQQPMTVNLEYQINQASTFQTLTQNNQKISFDFIQLIFLQSILLPNSNQNVQLNLSFSQQINLSSSSFCSINSFCSQLTQTVQCNISQNSMSITINSIDTYSKCRSELNAFNITIHNPEINYSNSGGGGQPIRINWSLTSSTTSQTLLQGDTSLTTNNTFQCPQPHCTACTSLPQICIQCTQGYYLLPHQNSCVDTCPPPTVAHPQTATCKPCLQEQECLQCQSQDQAACTSCAPTYSLNSTALPYCYVPLPSGSSSPISKGVATRKSSDSRFSGGYNRLEQGQLSQKQQVQASDEGGFVDLLGEMKHFTKGFILTLLIPLSILGAWLTRLLSFCLKKGGKKVSAVPSASRNGQVGVENLDERQETQKDVNGGDEEQMRPSSRLDTANGNMYPLNSRGEQLLLQSVQSQGDGAVQSEGTAPLAFCWIAVILLFSNLGDLVEVPYIIFSQQNSSSKQSINIFDLSFSEADMGQIFCLSYIVLNAVCYLICVVMMVKAILFENGSDSPLFSIYKVSLSNSSSYFSAGLIKKEKIEVEGKGNLSSLNQKTNKQKVNNEPKLWQLILDILVRCLMVLCGKAFCMVYSNMGNVKGWLTCQVNINVRIFRQFYIILCIHALFNMAATAFFTLMLTHLSFASITADAAGAAQDSLTTQSSDGNVEFSFFTDVLTFKFLMSLICFFNCLHIQQLINSCKSLNLPIKERAAFQPVQNPSSPSSSSSPAAAAPGTATMGKASSFENTPNTEKMTPTAVTLSSYRQQETPGTNYQSQFEGKARKKNSSKLSILLKRDPSQKSGNSLSSRNQETPSPNLPTYSPNLYPSQAYI